MPSRSDLGEGHVGIEVLDHNDDRTPRGHRGWHVRKECAVKARNHLWVASALPHSEGIAYKPLAVKSRCARRWGGWGRLSVDGPRQHNSDQNEDLWGGGPPTLQGGARSSPRPDTARDSRRTTTCTNGGRKPNISQCMPGAALAGRCAGRPRPKCQPSSRIGENPPYGMIGRAEETTASFEARVRASTLPDGGGREVTRVPTAKCASRKLVRSSRCKSGPSKE